MIPGGAVAPSSPVVFGLIGQGPDQNLTQPRSQLPFPRTQELGELSVCLQERLLDQVRGIELNLQRRTDQRAGQEPKIIAVQFQ